MGRCDRIDLLDGSTTGRHNHALHVRAATQSQPKRRRCDFGRRLIAAHLCLVKLFRMPTVPPIAGSMSSRGCDTLKWNGEATWTTASTP